MPDFRNPHRKDLIKIARNYAEMLKDEVRFCNVALGGSLASDTAPIGHNDIDLRLLAPDIADSPKDLRKISRRIENIAPFKREYEVSPTSGLKGFYVVNEKLFENPGIGGISLDVCIMPERSYTPLGMAMLQLPKAELDAYVEKKYLALQKGDEMTYRKIKHDMYNRVRYDLFEGGLKKAEPFWL